MRLSKKLAIAAVSTVATVGIATSAFAYWTTTGTGSGSAKAGDATNWAVSSDPATGNALSPGGPTDTVAYHVTNNGSGHQKLQAVSVAVKNSDGTTWSSVSGCSSADFAVNIVGFTATDLGPGQTYDGSATIQMVNNTSASQDGCKNATVPLYFSAS
jgi:hypothetical protein